MSFLTPLYLLGALAILGPIVFHLIRKTPRGQVPFSSLMFLQPTPPRLTRRSRLDDVLLLLLRVLALGLLAFAFARPFLREAASLNFADSERRRVTVLIDASASMRRGDLWSQAIHQAEAAILGCRAGDQLAVLAFDASTHPLLTFGESNTLDPTRRQAVALARLKSLEPTWASTDLGLALVEAVAATEDVADASEKLGRMPRRIVLVTDLQQGSRLEALGDFEWPKDVELDLKLVKVDGSNAGLQAVLDEPDAPPKPGELDKGLRVRVSNEPGAARESFRLIWADARGKDLDKPVEAYVPPGESRVVVVPRQSGGSATNLRLEGDAYPFDNRLYVAATRQREATVIFVGDDPVDDPNGLLYYLDRVFEDAPGRLVRVVPRPSNAPLSLDPAPSKDDRAVERTVPLVVLAGETTPANLTKLQDFARLGGSVLQVLKPGAPSPNPSPNPTASNPESSVKDAMLGELAFDHPLFSPFAGAQFNDFTKIRFWKHRRIDVSKLKDTRVLARFEGGDPAIVEQRIGKGAWIVLASGWSPSDSQLARSSKFVPLMAGLLESGDSSKPKESAAILVGDRVPLPVLADPGKARAIRKPDGSTLLCDSAATSFEGLVEPGIYAVEAGGVSRPFAVNLDPMESRTAALSLETLEQLGCRMASETREAVDRERLRQMQTVELESRQKLWRWLILATIGILIVETWLAGRLHRARAQSVPTLEPLAR